MRNYLIILILYINPKTISPTFLRELLQLYQNL